MVEALGCGCPVVTTRQPATNDVFDEPGPAGLAEPGSSASLATEIIRVLQAPARACVNIERLRGEVVRRFDLASVSRRYSNLLAGLVCDHSGRTGP
jgi:glycosyltransferase involved in cell wall biosynthesis